MDAFVLTVGKANKPKLKEADGSSAPGCPQQPLSPPEPGKVLQITVVCHNMTMDAFATQLHQMAGGYLTSPVMNSTSLNGAWDFDIRWTPRGALAQAGDDGISIFDAVDRELGLKLEFQKFPTPVIVVDSVNQKPTDNPPGIKQTLPPPPPAEFEVAALKPSLPDAKPGGRGFQPGGRIDFQAIPLSAIIGAAWDINLGPGEDIAGAPKWVSSAKYDLVAKTYAATGGTNANNPQIDIDDLRAMLRKLLIDRLKMVIHYEDRPQNAYTLVAAKPKLKKADPLGRTGCKVGPAPVGKDSPSGPPPFLAKCQNITMAQFAEQLPTMAPVYFHNPVLDASGIEGAWDFTLAFSPVPPNLLGGGGGGGGRGGPAGPPQGAGPAPGGAVEASEPSSAISLFDAVERQLGMKLEMHKRALPVLVIDHIEEKPDN